MTVINDASPEPELTAYLQDLDARKLIQLVEHQSNKGFVASVNEGMALHTESDVLLLNSDTEVFGNWVDRLSAHAYKARVASVTPFSNNATICSYPKFCENNTLPPGFPARNSTAQCWPPTPAAMPPFPPPSVSACISAAMH